MNTTLKDFLLEIKEEVVIPFAASINKEFIPQAHYESTILKDHDEVELVIPMQGG
ncbi:sulfur carrier protein ThiS [Wolbachia endosymbiont of Ctenocephalides felis wCfeT]|uniref:sulfur carrier protein ThiS n=1 Tax=Wolbachia endosymbiont of Ctenocephalides felis wCfeT TaxID=2732593 RepID=UPI0014471C29|nr:sulfur carrier protein ThiS [Wolbachia endosymbiont of Ctenocephalides felis wCfeT]